MADITKKDAKQAAATGDIAVLRQAAGSRDKKVHGVALKALTKLKTPEAVEAIAEHALGGLDLVAQAAAAQALYNLDDPRWAPAHRRGSWLRGEIDQEPDTTVSTEAPARPDPLREGLELLPVPPGDPDRSERITVTGPDGVIQTGGHADVLLSLPKWPDPKATSVTVTIWRQHTRLFQHEQDDRVRTTMTGAATQHASLAMGQEETTTEVRVAELPATAVDGDGRVATRVTIPADEPPTVAGVVEWKVQVDVKRQRGANRSYLESFTVDPGALAEPTVDPDDWLLRLIGPSGTSLPYEDRVAPAGIERHLQLDLESATVAPGHHVVGRILVDQELQTSEEVPMRVTLECWRGSRLGRTCHRMIEVVGDAVPFSAEHAGIDFRILLPETADSSPCACRRCPTIGPVGGYRSIPVPPTFLGTELKKNLDDVRWRVVARAFDAAGPEDPWWAATEVVVAPAAV